MGMRCIAISRYGLRLNRPLCHRWQCCGIADSKQIADVLVNENHSLPMSKTYQRRS